MTEMHEFEEFLPPIKRLSRDLRLAAETLSDAHARYLVDEFYNMQAQRIRAKAQVRGRGEDESEEPHEVIQWLADQSNTLEKQIEGALGRYTNAHPIGKWMRNIKGIGPVLSAGYLAHIDITQAPTVGHIWAFAGLDPSKRWEKKAKRPWNARLKVLCWKTGESFVKLCNDPDAFYGQVYSTRKQWEEAENEAGHRATQAKHALEAKKFRDDTKAKAFYLDGKLPPAHVHARAKRYTVKLFLSHLHHRWHLHEFGEPPAKPYVITQLGHGHYIPPPD